MFLINEHEALLLRQAAMEEAIKESGVGDKWFDLIKSAVDIPVRHRYFDLISLWFLPWQVNKVEFTLMMKKNVWQ